MTIFLSIFTDLLSVYFGLGSVHKIGLLVLPWWCSGTPSPPQPPTQIKKSNLCCSIVIFFSSTRWIIVCRTQNSLFFGYTDIHFLYFPVVSSWCLRALSYLCKGNSRLYFPSCVAIVTRNSWKNKVLFVKREIWSFNYVNWSLDHWILSSETLYRWFRSKSKWLLESSMRT